MARPSKLPAWNINEANAAEPPSSRQTDGWAITGGVPEKPPVEWHNYIWNLQYKWIDYLDTDKADKVDVYTKAESDTNLALKAEKSNVLELNNTTAFTPASDYEPATKKYVDDGTSDKITLAQANAHDLGVGQTWQDVTASRSIGVTYTNTTGKPIVVSIFSHSNNMTILYVDSIQVGATSNFASGQVYAAFAIVPNGSDYKASGGSFNLWHELR